MSLLEKLKKNSTIKDSAILKDSKFFTDTDIVTTSVPAINIALSGSLNGGFTSGLTFWVGPSKHFKTCFTLLMIKAYLDKYKDAVCLFYDSEFGSPQAYFETFGIDTSRILHTPVMDIEELTFDIMKQLTEIKRGDKVFIALDSAGNIASKKEVEDAVEGKSVQDMTRAKKLKSLFRMITPHLATKKLPMVVVNHSYQTQEMYSKTIMSGGCLVAGTEIILADGTLKCIEDIVIGDSVQTLDGAKPVTHTWDPESLLNGNPECYEITFEDGHTVTTSDNHKFLLDGKWVCAKDLSSGDDVTIL